MPNSLLLTWVKNVYSLGIAAGKSGGRLYTPVAIGIKNFIISVHKRLVIPPFIPAFYPQLSTVRIPVSPLLFSRLYPESTVPTINPIKEK